ncbi:MAG TPA: TOMM precursor leader peptide-binding protein [Actinophytocola sp.]|uniref:TOMM precursor leader peptide-binding protein n=1 Tax=Actinophytocola sp. TaxID=1872138 RepID=UPI002DDCA5FA|nr:TOMM precursor leader peptide-binding protein [Actinophytocola sp.]HEV2780409.1 TOMM precursor leader peptide-binding protein [Actinophytocola sp.]
MNTGAGAASLVGFKRHLRAEVSAGEGAYLFSERGVTVLKGSRVESLAALLDGTRNIATVLDAMPGGLTPEQVAGLIRRLAEAGLVVLHAPVASPVDERALVYWDASGIDSAAAVTGISTRTLRLLAVGNVDLEPARSTMGAAGLTVATEGDPEPAAALTVVLCDDYLNPELAEIDAVHRAANRTWLLAKPVGATLWLGPVFQPPEPGCWNCLAVRLWTHRNAEAVAQRALGRRGPAPSPAAAVPALSAMALDMVALEATKWLAGYRHPNQRRVLTFDSLELRGEHHELRPYPQCTACGNPALMREQAHRPVVLTSRRKASYSGGGHRSLTPEQVLARYRHLISPVTGVVKEIRRDEHGPEFFQSFRSGPNVAARVSNLSTLRATMRMENGGKGTTALHAEASALCEAIERHCGNFRGDEERIRGSLRSLGERAIHPNTCMLYDERQYRTRVEWNAAHGPFQHVCAPFDEDAIMNWTPVWSFTEGRHRLLPTGLLYYCAPEEPGPHYLHADSNGNAAGSSLEDAVLQGLLELIERDAVALWWYNRTRAPGVDLDAFGDPWTDELRGVYAGLGREVWVLDLTSDFDVPVMVALSRRADRSPEEIMLGFGAHLDPRLALRRALTELNQMMPVLLAATSEGAYRCDDPDMAGWLRSATLADHPYLVPDPVSRRRGPRDYGYVVRPDLLEDVAVLQSKVESLGMELLVLDQTRPDIGLPVVKVIVPGMRHFWARLGPGRLHEVPVRLGRLREPTPYENLNSIPMFM